MFKIYKIGKPDKDRLVAECKNGFDADRLTSKLNGLSIGDYYYQEETQ